MLMLEAEKLGRLPIRISAEDIAVFCRRWSVIELALFGSVLRPDFRDDSDVDVIVTFDYLAHPTLLTLAQMEAELTELFGREVDLSERRGLDQCDRSAVRNPVLESARTIYAR